MSDEPAILNRLVRQLSGRGIRDARDLAVGRLREYGILDDKGELTAYGIKRNSMTPAQRAQDRASRRGTHPASDYHYDPATNRATLR